MFKKKTSVVLKAPAFSHEIPPTVTVLGIELKFEKSRYGSGGEYVGKNRDLKITISTYGGEDMRWDGTLEGPSLKVTSQSYQKSIDDVIKSLEERARQSVKDLVATIPEFIIVEALEENRS